MPLPPLSTLKIMEKILCLTNGAPRLSRGQTVYNHVKKTLNTDGSVIYVHPLDAATYSLIFKGALYTGNFFMALGPIFVDRSPSVILEPIKETSPQVRSWAFFNSTQKNSFIFGQSFFEHEWTPNLNMYKTSIDSYCAEMAIIQPKHRLSHFRAARTWDESLPTVNFHNTDFHPSYSYLRLDFTTPNTFAVVAPSEKAIKDLTKWLKAESKTHPCVNICTANSLSSLLLSTPSKTHLVPTTIFYTTNGAEDHLLTTPKTSSSMYLRDEGEICGINLKDLLTTLHHCTLADNFLPVLFLYTDGSFAVKTRPTGTQKNIPLCFSVLNKSDSMFFSEIQTLPISGYEFLPMDVGQSAARENQCLKRSLPTTNPPCIAKRAKSQKGIQKLLTNFHKHLSSDPSK